MKIKGIYKLHIVLLAILCLVGISIAEEIRPSAVDKGSIYVYGIEADSVVNAYKIVKADYNVYGLLGYEQVEASKAYTVIEELSEPSYENVAILSKAIKNKALTNLDKLELKYNASEKCYYSDDASAGSYIVIVEHETKGYIYNSMYVSLYYNDANDSSSLGVDIESNIASADENAIYQGNIAYAKKDTVPFEKVIINSSTGDDKFDDKHIGDNVYFEISTKIPDYSDCYEVDNKDKIKFEITDKLSAGLDVPLAKNIVVKAKYDDNDNILTEGIEYTLSIKDNEFKLTFDSKWIKDNSLVDIIVDYNTIINDKAVIANNSNPNIAKLEYTTVHGDTFTKESLTRHYTFGFNILKLDQNKNVLAGATFELKQINNAAEGNLKTYSSTSKNDGLVEFYGLDSGEYVLCETKAPEGKAIVNTQWKIKIEPTYDPALKRITSYKLSINEVGKEQVVNEYTYTVNNYSESDDRLVDFTDYVEDKDVSYPIIEITNTDLLKLPSTGGNGSLLIIILGLITIISGICLYKFYNKHE